MSKRDQADKPRVYFAPLPASSEPTQMAVAAESIWSAMNLNALVPRKGLVAIKQHFGEMGGKAYLPPEVARVVGRLVRKTGGKPFLTDSNTLYSGARSNAVDHLELARKHGFSHESLGFPVLIADGLKGEAQVTVPTRAGLLKRVFFASAGLMADAAVVLTHVTGHMEAGMGASIKNVAMGFAGRGGKLHQHHGAVPKFDRALCTACGRCARACPAKAIKIEKHAVVDAKRCIGCGQCFAVCPRSAVDFDWNMGGAELQRRMAEYCLAFHREKQGRIAYFNFLTRVTRDCDCVGKTKSPLSDVGVVASRDPVAADSAAADILNRHFGRDVFKAFWPKIDYRVQLAHGEAIGLGSANYELLPIKPP